MSAAGAIEAADGARAAPAARDRRAVGWWLIACCALVFAMVVLGGVTRLTGSGLSMVAWEPISGALPPIGHAAWEAEFARYRASPEFMKVNYWMSLADFQRIFWFEWAHRLLGRLIGVVFLVPFVFFVATKRVDRALAPRLAAMFVLGGLQGLLGWYMVKSGLVDDPRVSQYRLAAHLGFAVVIYAYMLWVALDLLRAPGDASARAGAGVRGAAAAVTALAFLTLLSGSFVAGLHAGLVYNTFPTMGGHWVPPDLLAMTPAWRNLFENVATVQFDHRVLALATFAAVIGLWIAVVRGAPSGQARAWAHAAGAVAVVQVSLGISTLLLHVPVPLAAAHQAGALALLTALLCLTFELRRR